MWGWIPANADRILALTLEHLRLSLIPVVAGLLLAVPFGWLANRYRPARAVLIPAAGVLYTIPSLALFVVLPGILGTQILSEVNIVVALTLYTVALLVRIVADALAAVPGTVVASATAMGYRPARRFFDVELPLAVPVLVAGLRVATASTVNLVTVGALIGVGGLGELFTEGFQLNFPTEIVTGVTLVVLLTLVGDALLLGLSRASTPWSRVGGRS
ncbi:MAG: ABC transporter permease [Pseudonocardia sp.]